MDLVTIKARDLPDAWFQAVYNLVKMGKEFVISHGSYAGQKRLEFDYVTINILHPRTRPLVPDIPPQYGIPNPVEIDYVDKYLLYLMEDERKPGENYTYGTYIKPQMSAIIERYKGYFDKTGDYRSNQESIIVGDWKDHLAMPDPPCCRQIDTRIQYGKLHFFIYFRSWDLWGGFPANLAGFQLLKEYMAAEIGVEDGEMVVSSKGLHLYDYVWQLARLRIGEKEN
jgi:thymidylate synthase